MKYSWNLVEPGMTKTLETFSEIEIHFYQMKSNSGWYTVKRIYFLTSYIWVEEKIIKTICKKFLSVLKKWCEPLLGNFLADTENLHKNLLLKISYLLKTDFKFFRLHNTYFRWSKRQEYEEQNLNLGTWK